MAVAAGKPVPCDKPIDPSIKRVNLCAANAVEAGGAPPVGFEDGRLALVLAGAALTSIAENRVVAVREIA